MIILRKTRGGFIRWDQRIVARPLEVDLVKDYGKKDL
jgi:hypothetical protein